MPTQQIKDYIQEQIAAGYSLKSIHSILIENGWPEETVTGVMSEVVGSAELQKNQKKKIVTILTISTLITILSIGGVLAYQFTKSDSQELSDANSPSQIAVVPTDTPEVSSELPAQVKTQVDPNNLEAVSIAFGENLSTCTPVVIEYQHPIIDEIHTKQIVGLENELCHFKETLPNNGLIECWLSETQRSAIIEYEEKFFNSEKVSVSISSDLSPSGSETTITETQDGIEIKNPLNDAYADGTCTVSGY